MAYQPGVYFIDYQYGSLSLPLIRRLGICIFCLGVSAPQMIGCDLIVGYQEKSLQWWPPWWHVTCYVFSIVQMHEAGILSYLKRKYFEALIHNPCSEDISVTAAALRMRDMWPPFVVLGLGLLVAGVSLLSEWIRRKSCLGQEGKNPAQTGIIGIEAPCKIAEGNTTGGGNANEEQDATEAGNTPEEGNTVEDWHFIGWCFISKKCTCMSIILKDKYSLSCIQTYMFSLNYDIT